MKVSRYVLSLVVLVVVLASPACFEGRTTTNKLAIFTAQVDAGLLAVTDATELLNSVGKLSPAATKGVYELDLKVLEANDLVRSRAKSGFDKQALLVILDNLLDDAKKLEASGVLGLSDREAQRFLDITNFTQFGIRSLQAVIKAVKPPVISAEQKARVSGVLSARKKAGAAVDSSVATDLVLILQSAILRSIDQSRMTADEAFADGLAISGPLRDRLKARIADL